MSRLRLNTWKWLAMKKKSFDVDKFADGVDDSTHDFPEMPPDKVKAVRRVLKCPRCGAKKWEFMRYNLKGKPMFCSECRHVDVQ